MDAASGSIRLASGDSENGEAGDLNLLSGSSSVNKGGDIFIHAGQSTSHQSGGIYLATKKSMSKTTNAIHLTAGSVTEHTEPSILLQTEKSSLEEVSGRVEITTGDSPLKSSGSIGIKTGDAFVEKGSIEIATGETIDGSESNSGGDITLKAGISEGILSMTSGSKSILSSNGEILLTTSTSKLGSSSIYPVWC